MAINGKCGIFRMETNFIVYIFHGESFVTEVDGACKQPLLGCVLVYRYTKERNINELRHNSMYGYENNRNSPVYRYTRTAPVIGR